MKKLLLKTIAIGLFLLAMPVKDFGQKPYEPNSNGSVLLNFHEIDNVDFRLFLLYHLEQDGRFTLTPDLEYGMFAVTGDGFDSFYDETYANYELLSKDEVFDLSYRWKEGVSPSIFTSIMMDVAVRKARNDNDHCVDSDPFCTSEVITFDASDSNDQAEYIPDKGCLGDTYNPSWFHMRIRTAGKFIIHMEGRDPNTNEQRDIDYCIWGPFTHPTTPCTSQLTTDKIIDCSYSSSYSEDAYLGYQINEHHQNGWFNHGTVNYHVPEVGEYYILLITNWSRQPCRITFTKANNSGPGETDCDIVPAIVSNTGPYCVGETIQLHVNAQEGATYHWTGPNGFSSNQQNPTRPNCTMNMSGDYTCVTTVGTHSVTASTEVHVFPNPTANFTATSVCLGNSTQFTNTSTTNPANQAMTYLWNFGDGQTSTQQNPTHQFATAGNHNVTLTVSCGNGNDGACTSTKTQNVSVYANPVANAGPDLSVTYGDQVTLSGSGGTGTFNYHWEPADKVVNPNAQTTQTVPMQESTTFTLTVTQPQGGCSSTDQVSVLVNGSNMTATASASPTTICLGETSQLQAMGSGGTGNFTYTWTPTIGLSAPNIANPVAHPTETTTYTCLVDDGLSNQVVSTTITVNYPEYEEETQYICPGESYNFYGQDYSEEGDYDYVTTTAQGCEKVITLHLHHYPSYPNAHVTTAYICPGTSYQFHGDYYYVDGTYQKNLRTVHGCDSIVWLNLTVYPPNDTIIVDPKICTTQTFNFHGTEYSNDGDVAYFDTIDSHGCLLVEKLVLTVGDYQMPPVQHEYVCYAHDDTPYFYWDKTGRHYTQDIQTDTILPDPNGECDIKYRLDLRFHQEYYQTDTLTVCDSYDWPIDPLNPYTSTNHHIVKTFTTGGGANFNCDSTYVLDLTVNYSHPKTIDTVACNEYFWQCGWSHEFDTILTQSGTYRKLIETALGCDSLITLNVQFDYSPTFPRVEGHSWVAGGSEFQYTIEDYWIETQGTHTTEWKLKYWGGPHDGEDFDKWDLVPYGDSYDRCLVYIYTYELDTVALYASTTSTGSGNAICGDTDEKSKLIICTPYGISENENLCSVDIYPNPNNGEMTLSFSNMEGLTSVKVFDMQGTLVDQFQVNNGFGTSTHSYSTSRLKAGVYFFSMAGQRGMVNKKVIIMK